MHDADRRMGVLIRLAVLEAEIECASYAPEPDDPDEELHGRELLARKIGQQRDLRLLLDVLDAREARR